MSSNEEILQQVRHDVLGTCSQLEAALPLLQSLLLEDQKEARTLLQEMARAALHLHQKLEAQTRIFS